MDLGSFEREWKAWIASQPIDNDVKMVPWAFVTTAEGFETWWKRNKSWLEWSDEQQRYLPRKTKAAGRVSTERKIRRRK